MSTAKPTYDSAPYEPNSERHRRRLADFAERAARGKLNVTLDVTLRASQTTTTVTDSRLTAFTAIHWMPMTANAASAAAAIWANPTVNGSVTLNHASSANTDQTFRLTFFG